MRRTTVGEKCTGQAVASHQAAGEHVQLRENRLSGMGILWSVHCVQSTCRDSGKRVQERNTGCLCVAASVLTKVWSSVIGFSLDIKTQFLRSYDF